MIFARWKYKINCEIKVFEIVLFSGMREYRAWTVDHSIQIVMPYYPCGSLNTYLDQQHPIPVGFHCTG